jgi:hypothetical protein
MYSRIRTIDASTESNTVFEWKRRMVDKEKSSE